MIDLFCDSFERVPQRIVLDIDDTPDAVHGGQQLALFNAHYDEYCFQPGFPRWIASLMTFLGGSAIRINAIPSSRQVKPVSPCG